MRKFTNAEAPEDADASPISKQPERKKEREGRDYIDMIYLPSAKDSTKLTIHQISTADKPAI
jgi:hypothetical protein